MTKGIPQLATINDCTGCMACVDTCPVHAITSYRGDDGHLYVSIDKNTCVGCLKCEKVCHNRLNYKGDNRLEQSRPFAAWAKDNALRSKSTSGGVFAAMATKILSEGGVVVGAAFDGRHAKHILIDRIEQLNQLQGSKYVQSNTEGIYLQIAEHLAQHKVLFSGVGCQVAAVLSYFSNHPNKNNLYTIDLICGGVPSDVLMEKYFATKPSLEAITSFRTKRKYELKGKVNGEEQPLGKRALPLAGFAAELTNRFSCYHCQFAFAHRQSDITIGDLWGEVEFAEERENGISLVIAHNERGEALLKESDVKYTPIEWKSFLFRNARLVIGETPMTLLRKRLERNIKQMSDGLFVEAYTSTATPKHPFLFLGRFYRKFKRKMVRRKNKSIISKLLTQ